MKTLAVRQRIKILKVDTLPLPHTLPNTRCGFEMMRVVEDMDDDFKLYVELADVMEHPHSWGAYLFDVARAIARDYSGGAHTLAICEGSIKSHDKYRGLLSLNWDVKGESK
jgi:hypothetical protein